MPHGTKVHMLVSKLHSGTSKTEAGQDKVDWHELLCFGSPNVQLARHHA